MGISIDYDIISAFIELLEKLYELKKDLWNFLTWKNSDAMQLIEKLHSEN